MRIAIFHDLPSGGAKRSLFEQVVRLNERNYCDEYSLSSADHSYANLEPLVHKQKEFEFHPHRLFRSPIGRLNQAQRWRDLLKLDALGKKIAQEIDNQDYDVVYAHPCRWTQAPLVIRHVKTPVVYYLQELPRHLYPEAWMNNGNRWRTWLDKFDPLMLLYHSTARKLDRMATLSSQRVLVNSNFMQAAVQQIYGISPQICYLGVDIEVFHPIPAQVENAVLSVGAIHQTKGFDLIIQSLGLINTEKRPAFRIVGNMADPNESQRLMSMAEKCGVVLQIEVNLTQTQLVERYNQCRLFVYAPHNEPFGLTPLEAMACGKAAVGVDEGGVSETIVDGITGRLVPREAERMAEAIEWYLTHPDERQADEQRALVHMRQNWTWLEAVKRIELNLQAVVG